MEVRSWRPEYLPLRNLLIVENCIFLTKEGQMDPDGKAVALVDIEEVHAWQASALEAACSQHWAPGYWAWRLVNVRPINAVVRVLAQRRLYEAQVSDELFNNVT
jgi:hypothetical protein